MKKALITLIIILNTAVVSLATLQVNWVSSGFYLNGTTPLLDPTGIARPDSTLFQLIWSPNATISLAQAGATDYLSGSEELLANRIVTWSDVTPSGEYAYWNSGDAFITDNGSGLPAGYETGYIYARVFQSTTPTALETYYAGPTVSAGGYYWDDTGTPPTPIIYNMNDGSVNPSATPQDMSLSPYSVQPVPEPATMALFALGLMTLGISRKRKTKV